MTEGSTKTDPRSATVRNTFRRIDNVVVPRDLRVCPSDRLVKPCRFCSLTPCGKRSSGAPEERKREREPIGQLEISEMHLL